MSNAPKISPSAFTGLFGKITSSLDPYTEASPVGVLASLISAYSAYIGSGPTVETGKGESNLSVWVTLVGATGKGRKGTATGLAMRVAQTAFGTWAEDSVIYGMPATGLGMITELADRAEGTVAQPVMFVEEEGDQFISAAKRDVKVGTYLRKAWDGMALSHKTKIVDIKVRKPHIGVIMHAQPKNWAAISGSRDASGGTYNRMLPLWVQQSKTLPVFQASDCSDLIRACARELRRAADYARSVDSVTVPRDVAEVFEAKHRPIIESMITNEAMSIMAERALAYLVRLAALYALSDRRDEVTVQDMDAALALVSYSIETIAYILPDAETSEELSKVAKIEAFIRDAGSTGRTATEMHRAFGVKASELHNIVDDLPTITVIKGESAKGKGGRPSVRYVFTGEPVSTWDLDEDIEEADIVEDVAEETNYVEEFPAMLVAGCEETPDDDEVSVPETVPTVPVPSAVEALRARMDAPAVEDKPVSAVDALRAMLDSAAVEVAEVPLTGVAALAAMLATATPVAETVKPVRVRKASKARPAAKPVALFPADEVAA